MNKHTYWYIGSVATFGKIIDRNWKASTRAKSVEEARRNLIYQYKKSHNMLPNYQIELVDKITLVA